MSLIPYFTKEQLIKAAKQGNERGYNRQLDPEALQEAENLRYPVTFSMIHEHIAGKAVEPHVRVIIHNIGIMDISMEMYRSLGLWDPVNKARSA